MNTIKKLLHFFKHDTHGKNNIELKNVTLVSVTGVDTKSAIKSLKSSMKGIEYYDIVLISHEKPKNLDKKITFKKCRADELQNKDPNNTHDYSKFMIYNLYKYIESDFALIVHGDGYVLRPQKWTNNFLKYDYIGAPWAKNIHFTKEGINVRVGNGGFSLRSKKLLNAPIKLNLPFTDNNTGYYNEDGFICVYYRKELEDYGIKYAPVEVALKFSYETECEDSYSEPFGFHKNKK